MKPQELLNAWQDIHVRFKLSPSQQRQFLRRDEVRPICAYKDEQILSALKKSPKLDVVLRILRGGGAGRRLGGDLPAPRPQPNSGARVKPQERRTRGGKSNIPGSIWSAPEPSGTTDPRYKW